MKSDLQKAQIENGLIDDLSSLILSTPSKISFKLPLTNQTPTSAASQQQDSTYSAELHLNPISNEHTFKIIEITKFRKITHFKLILQRASDDRIKHFLSVVVQQRSAEAKNLIEQLVQAQLQLNRTNQETLTLQKRVQQLELLQKGSTDELRVQHLNELNSVKQMHAQQLEQYRVENEIQRKRMEDGHASALASLQVQNSQLSDDVSKLGKQLSEMTHNKQSTDEQLSMKTNQLEQSERTRSDLLRQTENLQSQLAQLEKSSKTQSERLIAVESILAEKEKYIQTLLISLESEKRRAGATEEKEQLLQQAHDALAEQLAQAGKEMERGNEQLRLQAEKIRKLVNKVKEKSAIIEAQEQHVERLEQKEVELGRQCEALNIELNATKDQNEKQRQTIANLEEEEVQLSKKVSEHAASITYLNEQLNKGSLGYRPSMYTPSYLTRSAIDRKYGGVEKTRSSTVSPSLSSFDYNSKTPISGTKAYSYLSTSVRDTIADTSDNDTVASKPSSYFPPRATSPANNQTKLILKESTKQNQQQIANSSSVKVS